MERNRFDFLAVPLCEPRELDLVDHILDLLVRCIVPHRLADTYDPPERNLGSDFALFFRILALDLEMGVVHVVLEFLVNR